MIIERVLSSCGLDQSPTLKGRVLLENGFAREVLDARQADEQERRTATGPNVEAAAAGS
jgi:hypothetical protein